MTISKNFIGLDIRFGTVTPPTYLVREPGAQYFVTSDGTSGGTITEQWLYNKNGWVQVPTATGTVDPSQVMQAVGSITQDITGFVDRTSSDYSWDNATRTFTLSPTGSSYLMYKRGIAYAITAPLTITIANTTGGRYIRFNTTTQQLEDIGVGAYPSIKEDVLVAYIYWDGTNALIVGDERHGVARDTQWHYSQHMDVGAIWRSGGTLAYTLDDVAANTLSIDNVRLADEDIEHLITHSASPTTHYQQVLDGQAVLPVIYVVGQTFVQTAASTSPWVSVSGTYQYNAITNGVGSLQPVNNSKFVNYWLIATNDSQYPIKLLMGQKQHGTVAEAELEQFETYDLPMPEFAEMYRITGQVNSGFKLVSVSVITGRQNVAIEAVSATSHANLTGRSTPDSHPIDAITGLQTSLTTLQTNIDAKMPKVSGTANAVVTVAAGGQTLNPANKVYIDPVTGYIGVNTTTPTRLIDAHAEGNYTASINIAQYNNGSDGSDFKVIKYRGTKAAPANIVNGDELGAFAAYGYLTTERQFGNMSINAIVSGANFGSELILNTIKLGETTIAERLKITSDGKIKFNQSYTFPSADGGNGQVLMTDGAGNLTFQALPSGVTLLSALSDAAITSPASGQFLVWNGTKWANTTKTIPTNLDSLTDVVITSATSGQILSFNGTNWVNGNISIPKDTTVVTSTGSSGVNFDYATTNLFYFTPNGSITTFNITNMPSAASSTVASAATIVIKQGATAYFPSAFQINGSNVTVKWFNGATPTASINAHDVITLNVLRDGANFIVLGQLVVFK